MAICGNLDVNLRFYAVSGGYSKNFRKFAPKSDKCRRYLLIRYKIIIKNSD